MRVRNGFLLGAILLFAIPAFAQDNSSKLDIALHFSFARWNPAENYSNTVNLYGGGGSITLFFADFWGIKGEFTAYGNQNQTFYVNNGEGAFAPVTLRGNFFTYLFGPVVQKHSGTFRPFGEFLLGDAHTNVYQSVTPKEALGTSTSSDAFAMAVGGGLDLRLNEHISLRLGEADYLLTHFNAYNGSAVAPFFSNYNQNNFRVLSGIVFSF
jgi:opacity protein-like surface antigen